MTEAVMVLGASRVANSHLGRSRSSPGNDVASRLVRTSAIEISADRMTELFAGKPAGERYDFQWFLHLDSMTPSGHVFRDKILLDLRFERGVMTYRKPPAYLGKSVVLATNLLMRGDCPPPTHP